MKVLRCFIFGHQWYVTSTIDRRADFWNVERTVTKKFISHCWYCGEPHPTKANDKEVEEGKIEVKPECMTGRIIAEKIRGGQDAK